jgi:hypothetical protein
MRSETSAQLLQALYLLHFVEFNPLSNMPLPEGRVNIAWEP